MEYDLLQNWPTAPDGTPEKGALLLADADIPGDVSILCSMLTSFGIPYYAKRPGLGEYLHILYGRTVSAGIELYVPSSQLELAKELLAAPSALEDMDDDVDTAPDPL